MSFSDPTQLVFPFVRDPNFCSRCNGYTRINPRCLHSHKLSRLVLFTQCDKCHGAREIDTLPCSRCVGRGHFYEIISDQELEKNPIGRRLSNGTIEPYANRL
jgi:hypothetical protein